MSIAERPKISERYAGDKAHRLVQMPYGGDPQERVILGVDDLSQKRPDIHKGATVITFVGTNGRFGRILERIVAESSQTMRPFTMKQLYGVVEAYMEKDR